jgi:HEPN domain-containing protein
VFNDALAVDYLNRSRHRLKALDVLFQEQSWADVVRESQELVEIALKALLRACRIEVPRIHDVSPLLEENMERLPAGIREQVPALVRISRTLRRDRELAFYGSEDLTPSEFYHRDDAENAFASAQFVHAEVSKAMGGQEGSMP